ncbi:MAG: peptide chain release factor 1 [Gammaproteobacteria bacterium]|nr:peptide chain release factor 1 [Gammaproteobacteria bacterium]
MSLSRRIVQRLEEISHRHAEIESLLGDPEVVSNQENFSSLSREYSELQPVVTAYERIRTIEEEIEEATELLQGEDEDLRILARETIDELRPTLDCAFQGIEELLVPSDPDDKANVFLEIRAGTGGEEAALFVADLAKMYERYALLKGWKATIVAKRTASQGGLKEAVFRISGRDVFARLKFESGTHRVQRIPQTESQGRIHTSACTVAILPEIEELTEVDLNDTDLRIDTFRASGAGGQHVNKTDSAVRITHLPSGTVAECQEERSQHQNRERAMALLKSKILSERRSAQEKERTEDRKMQVGSGDRSERIRTYNFPQGRLTDHRVQLTLYKLDEVMEGALDLVIEPLAKERQADLLRGLKDDEN